MVERSSASRLRRWQPDPVISTPGTPQPEISTPVAMHPTLPLPTTLSPFSSSQIASRPAPSTAAASTPAVRFPGTPKTSSSSAGAPRSVVSSYPAKPRRSFCGPVGDGAAGIAACIAVGIGIFTLAPGRIGSTAIQESTAAWGYIRNAATSFRSYIAVRTHLVRLPSSLNVQAAELFRSEKSAVVFRI